MINQNFFKITAFLPIFFQFSLYASGSYLFCINDTVTNQYIMKEGVGWNWAKGDDKNNLFEDYKDIVEVYPNGVWLKGRFSINIYQNFTPIISLKIYPFFYNDDDALNFCETLKKKCQNDFGEHFSKVGVSSWAIPKLIWGKVALNVYDSHENNYEELKCDIVISR